MRPVLLFLLGSVSVWAQPFSAGIKAGIPLTDFLNATENGTFNYEATMQRYIIGGVAEVRLPLGLGVEFDALYRPLSYYGAAGGITVSTSASSWEFPLLLKYRFHFPVVKPYVDAGVAWDTLTGFKQSLGAVTGGSPGGVPLTSTPSAPPALARNTTMGFVIGGGVDIHAIFLHISPEIRFTRWNSAQINTVGLQSNLNQAEFLVGFTF
jgi:hypothetical protein